MKKVIIAIILASIAIAGSIYLDFSKKNTGTPERAQAFDEGYEEGISLGCEMGYENGYDDGYDAGYKEGYSGGESDGYYIGATYTCLFFGDVDKAFQSAKNGAAWYTFVDAYNQYISKIYDNNDTRLSLIWSLTSLSSDDGASEDEKNLLVSTFGEDLFIRNGINWTIP